MQNVSVLKMPIMKPIKQIMEETGLSYKYLVQLCQQNKITHIRTGKKYLINYEKFIEFLNVGDKEE